MRVSVRPGMRGAPEASAADRWYSSSQTAWEEDGARGVGVLRGADEAGKLYENHVVHRTPVVIRGCADAVLCGPARHWAREGDPLAELAKMVAEDVARGRLPSDGRVVVETASAGYAGEGSSAAVGSSAPLNRRFGHGVKEEISFSAFADEVRRGGRGEGEECSLYLSASEIPPMQGGEDGEDDAPELPGSLWLATPMDSLYRRGGVSVRLPENLVGGLVTSSVNMWCGRSAQGSSSGLHHDFHDNVYVLLRGRKRFLLFPPGSAEHFAGLRGADGRPPVQQFANGFCAYGSDDEVLGSQDWRYREDGAMVVVAARARMKRASETFWALEENKGADEAALVAAASEVEASEDAYFAILARQRGSASGKLSDDDSDDEGKDDDNDNHNDEDGDDEDDKGEDEGDDGRLDQDDADKFGNVYARATATGDADVPKNFCACGSVELLAKDLSTSVGDIAERIRVCEVRAGEMLYLPAGWYHEVISFNGEKEEGGASYHMAINYWLHPPCTGPQYTRAMPYPDNFWAERLQTLAKRLPPLDESGAKQPAKMVRPVAKRMREDS